MHWLGYLDERPAKGTEWQTSTQAANEWSICVRLLSVWNEIVRPEIVTFSAPCTQNCETRDSNIQSTLYTKTTSTVCLVFISFPPDSSQAARIPTPRWMRVVFKFFFPRGGCAEVGGDPNRRVFLWVCYINHLLYLRTYLLTYLPTYLLASLPPFLPTYLLPYLLS